MDNKRTFLNMVVVAMLCVLWLQVGYPWMARKFGWHYAETPTTQPAPEQTGAAKSSAATAPAPTTAPLTTPHIVATTQSISGAPVTLGSFRYDPKGKISDYPIGLALSPKGAAVASVTLNRFRDESDQPEPYVYQRPYDVESPLAAALATRSVTIDNGDAIAVDQLDWQSAGPADAAKTTAAYQTDLAVSGSASQVRIVKSYRVETVSDRSQGYEVTVDYTIANLSAQEHKVRLAFNGPNVPKPENTRDLPEVVAGFDGGQRVDLEHSAIGSLKHDKPTLEISSLGKGASMLWSGVGSVYFNAIIHPTDAAGNTLNLPTATAELLNPAESDIQKHAVAIDYQTDAIAVPAHGSSHFVLHVYFGPKSRAVIDSGNYYPAYPLAYNKTLVMTSGCYALCTWSPVINALVWLLWAFHLVLRDWGLAIIGLVLLVRLILHPITKSSQISMSKMTKLGPEMERLKKKYGEDTEGLKQAQIEFYREQGIAPFLGCLPMFLQTPIWIALWSALQSTFEIRQAPFLRFGPVHLTWIKDLAQADHLITLAHPIDLFFLHIDGLNLLPIMMAVVFYINQKFMPQPIAVKPEQAQQQKMMQWMSLLLFPLFLYSSPSGLNLYIFTSTLIGIFEMKRIRAHIKEREEREQQSLIIVDEPLDANNRRGGKGKKSEPQKPPGGIIGLFMKLQQFADDAKQKQEKQKKKTR
jgi:YidC/Oxa1 family membrane protein insertase